MSVSEYELVGGKGANVYYYLIPFNPGGADKNLDLV